METLTDAFPGPSFTANWNTVASPSIIAGQAHMPTTATKSRLVNANYYDFTDSFVLAQITQAGGPVGNGSLQNMICTWDLAPNNYAQFYVQEETLVYLRANAGVQTFPYASTYDPVAHAWWRIRVTAGVLYAETSPDGLNWTTRDSIATWFDPTQGWTEFGSQLTSGTASDFVVDNFNLPPVAGGAALVTPRRPSVIQPGVPHAR